jgi:hypothetical protein
VPRDDLVATPKPEERSAPRKFTFGKEADDFTRANAGRGFAHGILRLARADRNAADRLEERMQKAVSINCFVENETDRPPEGELEHDGVDPGNVIRQEEDAAFRHLFAPNSSDAIKNSPDCSAERAQRPFQASWFRHCL